MQQPGAMTRRLIERSFPSVEVSESVRYVHHNRTDPITQLQRWWGHLTPPLARAVALAALLPYDDTCYQDDTQLVADAARAAAVGDGGALSAHILERVQDRVHAAYGGRRPKVLDPFSGVGTFPRESLMVGADAVGLDLSPVAVLATHVVVRDAPMAASGALDLPSPEREENALLTDSPEPSSFTRSVAAWLRFIERRLRERMRPYERLVPQGRTVRHFWTVLARCPACGIDIPLLRDHLLPSSGSDVLRFVTRGAGRDPERLIVPRAEATSDDTWTVRGHKVRCPACGAIAPRADVLEQVRTLGRRHELLAVIDAIGGAKPQLVARRPDDLDRDIERRIAAALERRRSIVAERIGIDPVPTEPIAGPMRQQHELRYYGYRTVADTHTHRQLLTMIEMLDLIADVRRQASRAGASEQAISAMSRIFALIVNRWINWHTRLVAPGAKVNEVHASFAAMKLTPPLAHVDLSAGDDHSLSRLGAYALRGFSACAAPAATGGTAYVVRGSATAMPWRDHTFDAIVTDPPYYDNIAYSDRSEHYRVWLKRVLTPQMRELMTAGMRANDVEVGFCGVYSREQQSAHNHFVRVMTESLSEMRRALRPDGVIVLIYAHMDVRAWIALCEAITQSQLLVTAVHPIAGWQTTRDHTVNSKNPGTRLNTTLAVVTRPTDLHSGAACHDGDIWHELACAVRTQLQQHAWIEDVADRQQLAYGAAMPFAQRVWTDDGSFGDRCERIMRHAGNIAIAWLSGTQRVAAVQLDLF